MLTVFTLLTLLDGVVVATFSALAAPRSPAVRAPMRRTDGCDASGRVRELGRVSALRTPERVCDERRLDPR
jgi:hypothetical protein